MRAVHLDVPRRELDERHRLGLDKLDEMWEGELHMVPPPSAVHQDMVTDLTLVLGTHVARRGIGRLSVQKGVFHPLRSEESYRIPDLVFVAAGNSSVNQERGVVGAADAVIEVRSPGDETYEKFAFFAEIGVKEIIVIDRDTRRPEIYRLAGQNYLAVVADADGWLSSGVLGVRFRAQGVPPRLRVEPLDRPDLGADV